VEGDCRQRPGADVQGGGQLKGGDANAETLIDVGNARAARKYNSLGPSRPGQNTSEERDGQAGGRWKGRNIPSHVRERT